MPIRILIVDDSPAMRLFITRTIELSGLDIGECMQAGDGEEALAVLRNHKVDVILSDINMPRMSGEEMVDRLRADEELSATPVIVVSTDSTEARVKRMLGLGACGYVRKPFTPELLRCELERVLGGADA